ncbi:mediator complex subunit [Ascosphaera aggregata]|nr:mediator complex subunit [Ascosphaera aggregata]
MAIAKHQWECLGYSVRWRNLLITCVAQRTQIGEFERLSGLALKEFPVPSRDLVEVLLGIRASIGVPWDPLIPEYLDSLYRQRRVTLQDILRCLLRRSTVCRLRRRASAEVTSSKSTLKRKRQHSACDTLMSDFRIIQNGLIAVTSRYPPLTKVDAMEILLAIVEWMDTILTSGSDNQQDEQDRQSDWIMRSPDGVSLVESLGILLAGLLTTQIATDAVIAPKATALRRKIGRALESYLLLCDQFSPPLRMRLESLQKEFNLLDRDEKSLSESVMGALNVSVIDFEASIIDTPPVNSRAGLYIYLSAMLVGRPLVDNGLLMTFLNNRYGGNLIAVAEELITSAFDILANAKNRNESLFLQKAFLINKVPSFLQEMVTTSPQPLPMELCISHALSRIDSRTFPSFSALFVNKFHKSSPLSDVRQEFVFSCALHKLIPEASIEPLLGENPMQSLPSGGQMARSEVVSQLLQYPDRLEQYLKKIESMDGIASVISVALTDRPHTLDVIMLFSKPSDTLVPLTNLIDTWAWEGKGENQEIYEEFSSILLLIMAFQYRFDLSFNDLGLTTGESFLERLFSTGHVARSLTNLDADTNNNIGSWIKALFVSEGISNESMSCSPKDYYLIVTTLVSQSVTACERNRLAFDILKGGLEYLLEPFLLPSLIFALRWLESHILDFQGDLTPSIRALEALVKPTSISGDSQEMHRVVLQIMSESLENTLKIFWVKHPNQADTISRIIEVLKDHRTYRRSPAVHHSLFNSWSSNSVPGGIVADLISTFSSLVYWSSNTAISLTPFSYTHCELLAALRTVGAVRVLHGIIKELQEQANSGSLDLALDIAASFVVAPTVETFERDQAMHKHQQALNENKIGEIISAQSSGSTLMSLRDALACEHEALSSESIRQDELRAQLVVRLHRRVNALTMPPQPVPQGVQVSNLDVANMLPDMHIDSTHANEDTGVQSIFDPVPGGEGAMPAAGNDSGGLNAFDMLLDDTGFMLDGMFGP